MTKKKKLFIHIGSHKTATTFIQGSLKTNQDTLLKMGVLYPETGQIYDAHFLLGWEARDAAARSAPDESLALWHDLIEEIQNSAAETAIISSEEFNVIVQPTQIAFLKTHFDVKIIHYIRSPDSFVESFYNQVIKDFRTRETRTINTYVAEEELWILNPKRSLSSWIEVFGKNNVIVRIFARDHLKNGILADFFQAAQLKLPEHLIEPSTSVLQKVSLPPDSLEYLRFANPYFSVEKDHSAFVVRLYEVSIENLNLLSETRSGILSHSARKAIRARYASQYCWVSQTFFDTDAHLFPVMNAPAPPEDFLHRPEEASPDTLGRVAALIHAAVYRH